MSVLVEVCIDNIESLPIAQSAGAGRIELCSSLALGGLTASSGYMTRAAQISSIPVYAIIRPREGDFLYCSNEIEVMLGDIYAARQAGLEGIVIGALKHDGAINLEAMKAFMAEAKGMGVTFHRAIDHCNSPLDALDTIMSLGCERVLTSGLAINAETGIPMLAKMVKHCGSRLSIMPGAGVNAANARQIIEKTSAHEIHLSGKTSRQSAMTYQNDAVSMGSGDDFELPVTDPKAVEAVIAACR